MLPSNRSTVWTPGIPEGIAEITGPVVNVVERYGVKNDSSADASDAVQAALDSLRGSGGVVYLPSGTYRIDKQLAFNGDGIVLRGAGASRTKLHLGFAGDALFICMYGRGTWQKLQQSEKGSATVTVTDGSAFTAGSFAELEQANDSSLQYTDPAWNVGWADSMVGQLFEVSSVAGNTVTFRTPLHFQVRNDLSPQIRSQRLRNRCGIEDLYLEKTTAEGHTIYIKNAAYCFVRRVESNCTREAHLETAAALGCRFTGNYFHRSFGYGDGGSGYGTSLHTHTTDCLVDDNIFNHLRHAMIIQNGATGNVFAYNFSTDPVQGESDDAPLNDGWDPPDISFHGHYAQYNLAEGNVVTEITLSDYWGPMGPGNTVFRNDVAGKDGISINDHSHGQNIIGNVAAQLNDDGTSVNTILHGNRFGTAAIQWNDTVGDHALPASLYLDNKPSFWTDDIPWPGTGSDLSAAGTNPAAERWKSGTPVPDIVPVTTPPAHASPADHRGCSLIQSGATLRITTANSATLTFLDAAGRSLGVLPVGKGMTVCSLPHHHGVIMAVLSNESGAVGFKRVVSPGR